jgi:hypothetical protein
VVVPVLSVVAQAKVKSAIRTRIRVLRNIETS